MTESRRNLAAAMGGWSARHRKTAIAGWLLFVIAAYAIGSAIGKAELQEHEYYDGESARAEKIIDEAGFVDPASEIVLIEGANATVDDPQFRGAVDDVVDAVDATGAATNIRTPYDQANPGAVSPDKHAALVLFDLTGDPDTASDRIQPVLDAVGAVQRAHPELRIEEAGGASADKQIGEAIDRDFVRAEQLSLPLTLGILLVAFGAILAAILPVALAMTAFFAATGLVALTSHLLHVDEVTANLMLLIGLAVGVDYSLFYLRREREERAKGRSPERALEIAAATSGRAVLISGLTVVIAMSGMFLTGNGQFMGFAEGVVLVVLTAVLGSVTVLPAVLALLGDRIDGRLVHGTVNWLTRRRVTWPRTLGRSGNARVWGVVLDRVLRRPALSAAVAGGLLVALAIPALGMRTATPGIDDLQSDAPVLQAFRHIEAAFPGGNDPAEVVIKASNVGSPEMTQAIEDFRTAALASGEAGEPFGVRVNDDRTVAVVTVALKGKGNDEVSEHAVRTLRDTVVPATIGQVPGAEAHISGGAAASLDFSEQMRITAPLVFVFVLLLAFLLLLLSFRSLVVAIKAIVLNLLSVAAAYGLLVLVFQHGWGEGLLGFESSGAIVNWLPLFLFVILFGLSMDYHVFILSRIREAYDRGMSTDRAVAHGIRATAGVVTSAALVMVAVFSVFAMLSLESIKQLGVGLAAAVLIDATIVRAVLLPATMKLLGEWNWYLPRWLEWLPRFDHRADADADRNDFADLELFLRGSAPSTEKAQDRGGV